MNLENKNLGNNSKEINLANFDQKVSEALKIIDIEQNGNPDQKYQSGSIRNLKDKEPYIQSSIEKLKENIMHYFDRVDKVNENKESNFKPNPLDYPNGYEGGYNRDRLADEEN